MTTTSTTPLWAVQAEFTSREDAVAFQELARELGYVSQLNSRSINKPHENPVRTWRTGKLALASMERGRSYDLDHFRAAFQAAGYGPQSASPVLTRLVTQGDVVRADVGTYQLAPQALGTIIEKCETCTTPALCDRAGLCRQEPLRSDT